MKVRSVRIVCSVYNLTLKNFCALMRKTNLLISFSLQANGFEVREKNHYTRKYPLKIFPENLIWLRSSEFKSPKSEFQSMFSCTQLANHIFSPNALNIKESPPRIALNAVRTRRAWQIINKCDISCKYPTIGRISFLIFLTEHCFY